MEAFEWFRRVVTKHYADFKGRARRTEYWYFQLVFFVIILVLGTIFRISDSILGKENVIDMIGGLAFLGLILPGIAVSVRRLHDVEKSGWWILLGFIPLVGFFVLLFWYVRPGTTGDNAYGADPKISTADVFS